MSRVIGGVYDHIVKCPLKLRCRFQFSCCRLMMCGCEVEQLHYACGIGLLLTTVGRPKGMFPVFEINKSQSDLLSREASAAEFLHGSIHYVTNELLQAIRLVGG